MTYFEVGSFANSPRDSRTANNVVAFAPNGWLLSHGAARIPPMDLAGSRNA